MKQVKSDVPLGLQALVGRHHLDHPVEQQRDTDDSNKQTVCGYATPAQTSVLSEGSLGVLLPSSPLCILSF